jgi:hypothetical protein
LWVLIAAPIRDHGDHIPRDQESRWIGAERILPEVGLRPRREAAVNPDEDGKRSTAGWVPDEGRATMTVSCDGCNLQQGHDVLRDDWASDRLTRAALTSHMLRRQEPRSERHEAASAMRHVIRLCSCRIEKNSFISAVAAHHRTVPRRLQTRIEHLTRTA